MDNECRLEGGVLKGINPRAQPTKHAVPLPASSAKRRCFAGGSAAFEADPQTVSSFSGEVMLSACPF